MTDTVLNVNFKREHNPIENLHHTQKVFVNENAVKFVRP